MATKKNRVFDLIQAEEKRQKNGAELIASENYVSKDVLKAMGSVLTNKYAEGLPGKRYYGGCEVVDEIENLAIENAKKLFNACWANVQPHSGAQANAAVMLAVLKPGDTILGFDLSHGGHLTHGSPVNFSGKLYKPCFYGVNKKTEKIDYNQVADEAKKNKPRLIICGASAYSRDWDYKTLREIADKNKSLLLADISHPSGLIARGLLNDPLPHCHIVSSTTHKTLRGPRGGIIMMGEDFENPFGLKTPKGELRMMSSLLDSAVFPGTQGGPLEHVIAAKAVAFSEALSDKYLKYCVQVVKNAARMAQTFKDMGYHIVSGGTDNHCFLLDLRNKHISGKEADLALMKAHITVNKNMVPFDDKSPMVTSGIRIGTAAVTTRGLKEKEITQLAHLVNEAIVNKDSDKKLQEIGKKVVTLMKNYPVYASV